MVGMDEKYTYAVAAPSSSTAVVRAMLVLRVCSARRRLGSGMCSAGSAGYFGYDALRVVFPSVVVWPKMFGIMEDMDQKARFMARCHFRRRQLRVQGWFCLCTPREVFLSVLSRPDALHHGWYEPEGQFYACAEPACVHFLVAVFSGLCVGWCHEEFFSSSRCRASSCPCCRWQFYGICVALSCHVPGDDRRWPRSLSSGWCSWCRSCRFLRLQLWRFPPRSHSCRSLRKLCDPGGPDGPVHPDLWAIGALHVRCSSCRRSAVAAHRVRGELMGLVLRALHAGAGLGAVSTGTRLP